MEPPVDIDAVESHASRYWMEDGLVEILLGPLMSVSIGVFWAAGAIPRGHSTDLVSLGGVQTLWLAVMLSILWGFKKLKARVTFPRGGYVALPKPTKMSRICMFALYAVFAVIFHFTFTLGDTAVPVATVIFAVGLAVLGLQIKLARIAWEGVLTLGIGVYLYWFTALKGSQGGAVLIGMVGSSLAIIGALPFRRFLKAHPLRPETEA